jgi:hypothetical protein
VLGPEANTIFNATMAAKAHANVAGIIAAYDFSGFKMIGDIGGGRGHLLRAVLDTVLTAKGVLFDQAHVVKEAAALASPRLALQSGDFFKDTLPTCDASAGIATHRPRRCWEAHSSRSMSA